MAYPDQANGFVTHRTQAPYGVRNEATLRYISGDLHYKELKRQP